MKSGIYKITHIPDGKIYIGRSVNLHTRLWKHKAFFTPQKYSKKSLESEINMKIHQAILKDRHPEHFIFEIIEYCSKEKLDQREQYYIKYFDCKYPKGYNQTDGGKTYPHKSGEAHPYAKITNAESLLIKQRLKEGKTVKEIIQEIPSATMGIISSINNGRTWYDEKINYPISPLNGVRKYTDQEIREIRLFHKNGMSIAELAKKYNTSTSTISSIITGIIRKEAGGPIRKSTKKPKLSKEQVQEARKKYSTGKFSIKELWEQNSLGISYASYGDMIRGKTYKEYILPEYPEKDISRRDQIKINRQNKQDRDKKIIKLLQTGIPKTEIAKRIGCSPRTIYRVLEKNEY